MFRKFDRRDYDTVFLLHCTYMNEINGAGIRWEFDGVTPSRIDAWMNDDHMYHGPKSHFGQGYRRLQERVASIGMLAAGVKKYEGRPIVIPHPMRHYSDKFSDSAITTREITASDSAVFKGFHDALSTYCNVIGQLSEDDLRSDKVREAAIGVGLLVSPRQWRESGADVPEEYGDFGVTGTGVNHYFMDVAWLTAPFTHEYPHMKAWAAETRKLNRQSLLSRLLNK